MNAFVRHMVRSGELAMRSGVAQPPVSGLYRSQERYGRLTMLRQIGEQFQVRDTAITEASRRVMKELEKDEQLRAVVEVIRRRFQL
jgi:hypothetical protein